MSVALAEPQIQALERVYTFREPERVTAFLAAHPQLVPVLLDAPTHVSRHFGDAARLALEMVTDPEDGTQTLFILVQTSYHAESAVRAMSGLDSDWWLAQNASRNDDLCIDIEFA